jgi:hypothetical protein
VRGEAQTFPSRCANTASAPAGTYRCPGEIAMASIARASRAVTRVRSIISRPVDQIAAAVERSISANVVITWSNDH